MPVTQEDIAQQLGISRGLVGYALNGHPRVSAKTKAKVREAAERMGYRPNSSARALVTGRTFLINLCLPALGNSFYSEIIRQFENLTHGTPYDLVVTTYKGLEGRATSVSGDGTIFYGTGGLPPAVLADNMVMVRHHLLTEPLTPIDNFDAVLLDLTNAAKQGMAHLIEQGFKRIAYVGTERMMVDWEPRFAAYKAALAEAGMEPELIIIPIPLDGRVSERTVPLLAEYFEKNGFPDALFCCNDDFAIGAYRTLRRMGRAIPAETAVMGVDDVGEGQDLTPPLTTIHLPLEDICRRAWELLLSRIDMNHSEPRAEIFEASLVVRESSLKK